MTSSVEMFLAQFLADDRLVLLSFAYLSLLIALHQFTRRATRFCRMTLLGGATAILLGYALLIPLSKCNPGQESLGQITSLTLNFGWLCLGLGLFIHVRKSAPSHPLA